MGDENEWTLIALVEKFSPRQDNKLAAYNCWEEVKTRRKTNFRESLFFFHQYECLL